MSPGKANPGWGSSFSRAGVPVSSLVPAPVARAWFLFAAGVVASGRCMLAACLAKPAEHEASVLWA